MLTRRVCISVRDCVCVCVCVCVDVSVIEAEIDADQAKMSMERELVKREELEAEVARFVFVFDVARELFKMTRWRQKWSFSGKEKHHTEDIF